MITNRIINGMGLAIMAAIVSTCTSPLSDVPVSEPSVLRAAAVAERDISASNIASTFFQLALRDKHEQWVHLKEGDVTVGGLPMSYNSFLGSYVRNDVVLPNATYTFVVTLSDGSRYTCTVRTSKDLNELTVPSSYDRTGYFTVSWKEVDGSTTAMLTVAGDSTSASYYPQSASGSYRLPSSEFTRFHGSQTLRITLTLTKPGQVDGRFMSTSTAASWFSITRTCLLR